MSYAATKTVFFQRAQLVRQRFYSLFPDKLRIAMTNFIY